MAVVGHGLCQPSLRWGMKSAAWCYEGGGVAGMPEICTLAAGSGTMEETNKGLNERESEGDPPRPVRDFSRKPTFTALLGLDQFASVVELILKAKLDAQFNLRFFYFERSSELLKLAEKHPFDLAFMYIGNIWWDVASADGSFCGAAGVLGELRSRYGKPIVATQGLELAAELEPKGVIFLQAPFTVEAFWARLSPELTRGARNQPFDRHFSVAICGESPDGVLDKGFLTLPLQEKLGAAYPVALHYFEYPRQWELILGEYDLYLLCLNPSLRHSAGKGDVDIYKLVAELKAKHRNHVIVLTNGGQYTLDCAPGFIEAGAAGFFSLLPPFPTEVFREALRTSASEFLATRERVVERLAESNPQPERA